MEEAVRNTWESKSKMSEEYEAERKRLIQEQHAAAQQLQSAKERNWLLLEQKAHLEMTVAHMRELSKETTSIGQEIDIWTSLLSKLSAMEKALTDQSTVVQVFKSALRKDTALLSKVSTDCSFRPQINTC